MIISWFSSMPHLPWHESMRLQTQCSDRLVINRRGKSDLNAAVQLENLTAHMFHPVEFKNKTGRIRSRIEFA
jgi:hypothetical protein